MRNPVPFAILALSLTAPASAAALPPCPLGAEAAVGRRVRVELESGDTVSGRLLRASPDALVVRSHGEERTLEAFAIGRVRRRSGGKTVRNILLSAGVGALAGAVFGTAYDEADSDSLAILFGLIGAGGGAGIGAGLPARSTICASGWEPSTPSKRDP